MKVSRHDPEFQRRVLELSQQGLSARKIADQLGCGHNVVLETLKLASKPVNPPPSPQVEEPPCPNGVGRPSTPVEQERERAQRAAEIAELRQQVSRRAVIEELRDAIRQAGLTVEPPSLIPVATEQGSFDEEAAVLIVSDAHMGQHTTARLNAGWEQTAEITQRQFDMLGRALLRIWDIQRRSIPWRTLYLFDLGDDVENDNLRPSQHRIIDPIVVKQTTLYGRALAGLVLTALQVFPRVEIHRVPGNHGRTTSRPGSGGLAELDPADSFDWLAGEYAREILREAIEQGRVHFQNWESEYGVTEIMGHRVIFEHGASLRGGQAWGGIAYYGIDKMAAAYRELEGEYSVLLLGHYHRPYMLPCGYRAWVVGNGSFPPTTPYSVSRRKQAVRPCQTLLSIHPKQGVTMYRRLYLDTVRQERRQAC